MNDAVLEELNELANRPLPGRTGSVMISFWDRCHFVGRLRCGWAAVQRSVGEDSIAEFGEVPVDLASVQRRHEGEDVGRHDLPGNQDRESGWVGRDEHGRDDLPALAYPCGQLLGRQVFACLGHVREEVRGPQVPVRAAQIVPEPVGEVAEVRQRRRVAR